MLTRHNFNGERGSRPYIDLEGMLFFNRQVGEMLATFPIANFFHLLREESTNLPGKFGMLKTLMSNELPKDIKALYLK